MDKGVLAIGIVGLLLGTAIGLSTVVAATPIQKTIAVATVVVAPIVNKTIVKIKESDESYVGIWIIATLLLYSILGVLGYCRPYTIFETIVITLNNLCILTP